MNATRAIVDWMRIVLLPTWLVTTLANFPHPTWIIVVETVLATLLVYWAAERRIDAIREWWMKELVKPSRECLDERSSPQGSASAEKPPSSPMVGANPAEPTPHHPRKVGA